MKPAISIIIPVYNVEKYLRRCLDGVLAQIFTNYECIIVDDASPDNCPSICDEYAAKDNRFKVIHKKQNEGLPKARKSGLDIAIAEFVMHADSDDWLEPNALELLYKKQQETNADIIMGAFRTLYEYKSVLYYYQKITHDTETLVYYFLNYCGTLWGKLYRKVLFDNYLVPEFNTVIFLIIPSFKDIWFSIIQYNAQERLERVTEYVTRYGMSGFSGFSHTHICSLAVLFSVFLILNDNKRKALFYYFCMITCFIGIFFYGMAGMLCSAIFISVFICYKIFLKRDVKLFLFLTFTVIILTLLLLYIMSVNKTAVTWFNWAFEPLINLFTKGTMETKYSYGLLNHMIFMPESKTLLFGDGFYTNNYDFNSYYMHTDSGIMRPILFYGLFLTGLEFSIPFIFIILIKKIMKKSNYRCVYLFICSLLFELIFFTIKGVIIQNEIDIYLIIISLLLLQYKDKYFTIHTNDGIIKK